jgi:hypothetical protein
MNREELRQELSVAGDNVLRLSAAIARWGELLTEAADFRANEDAQIYRHLHEAFDQVLDPTVFPRLRDPQGHRVTIPIGEHALTVTVTHRGVSIEDVHGVDVIYQYEDEKALAFQHKKRGKDGYLHLADRDFAQRDKIQNLCGVCRTPQRAKGSHPYVMPYCSSLYVISDAAGKRSHFVSACMLENYRRDFRTHDGRRYVRIPIPGLPDTIDGMFLMCLVGRVLKDQKERVSLASIRDSSLAEPNLLLDARLKRKLKSEQEGPGYGSQARRT